MTQRLHASLKPHIDEVIASSVRLQKTRQSRQAIENSGAMELFMAHRCPPQIPLKESSDATKACRGC
jgi:hypothetical protein